MNTALATGRRSRELADGVARIRLDSRCGLVVNAYVLQRDGHVALVDTGFPYTVGQLETGLAELGLRVDDIDDVLYTHLHVDHVGGGVALAPRWAPREWLWEGALPAFGDVFAHLEQTRTSPAWAAEVVPPDQATARRVREMRDKPRLPWRVDGDGTLSDPRGVAFGEVVDCGPWRVRCVDGRGHDPTHVGWYVEGQRWLFCGDAVLAVPTPIVRAMGDDLKVWVRTVHRWSQALDVAWLLPGHGMPTRLVEPSYARSLNAFERVYDATLARLSAAGIVDPLGVASDVLPGDRSRYAARSSVLLANADAVLHALAADGYLEEVEPQRFLAARACPPSWQRWVAEFGAGT